MDISTVLTFIKQVLATFLTLIMMISPNSMGNKPVAYEAENPDTLVMSFAAVSDIHVETNFPDSYRNYSDVLYGIKAGKDIDAVAYTGDNVMNGQLLENFFFYMGLKFVKPSKENFVVVGNHDVGNGEGDYEKLRKDFIKNNNNYIGNKIDDMYYYRVVNGCYMIVLASEDSEAQTFKMSDAQYTWLEGVLKKAKADNAPTIILNHFPIRYLQDGHTGEELAALFNTYGVDLFIHGHIHDDLGTDNFYNWNGINCINLPRVTEVTLYAAGDGVVVEIYENEILVRGRDFINGQWIDGLQYRYPLSK